MSGVILTSGKKMFFAGGDLSIFLHVTKADALSLKRRRHP